MRHADQPSDEWLRVHRKAKWAREELRNREQRQRNSAEPQQHQPISREQAKASAELAAASLREN
jgi:hypothetical protein